MNKKIKSLLLVLFLAIVLCACGDNTSGSIDPSDPIDYVATLKLDPSSGKKQTEVTVRNYIDGDTTHFNTDDPEIPTGLIKARYLGVDTPESTGMVQPWGKAASDFTKSRLKEAESIVVQSEDGKWNLDSTGTRYLCWVWYRTSATEDYRLLNLELLQEGYSAAKNLASLTYAETLNAAYRQALNLGLRCVGTERDPGYDYSTTIPLVSLKYLKSHLEDFDMKKVRFEGVVTRISNQTAYVEDYDEETGISYGMQVYLGFGFTGMALVVPGNRLSIAATITYYETGGTYQASGVTYQMMRDPEDNLRLVSTGNPVVPTTITYADLSESTKISITEEDDTTNEYAKPLLIQSTYVKAENLEVKSIYTTNNGGDNDGAMTLTCQDSNGHEVVVRTIRIYDEDMKLITKDAYLNQKITVTGIVDLFDGSYQVKVFTQGDITVIAE